jgi:hypothetical protein
MATESLPPTTPAQEGPSADTIISFAKEQLTQMNGDSIPSMQAIIGQAVSYLAGQLNPHTAAVANELQTIAKGRRQIFWGSVSDLTNIAPNTWQNELAGGYITPEFYGTIIAQPTSESTMGFHS